MELERPLRTDARGNVIIGVHGEQGQYRAISARTGEQILMCGNDDDLSHLAPGVQVWDYKSARFVCSICWPRDAKAAREAEEAQR